MKQSIEWHRRCLRNVEIHLAAEEQRLARQADAVENARERARMLRLQIDTAENEGRDGFDSERYLVNRRA